MRGGLTRETGPWIAVAVGWGLAFSLACRLSIAMPGVPQDTGVIGILLGESRSALSANFYDEADTFFHKGVAHYEKRALTNDWIQTWRENMAPTTHQHAEGGGIAEIIPWLQLATQADPHNVEASLVMAFWVNTGLHRPELARQILMDTQRQNPTDYRIPLGMGRLAIQRGQFAEAQIRLSAAVARWPSSLAPADRQVLLDKAEALTLLGFLSELNGYLPQAIANFKNTLAIFPERSYIKDRVDCLESGRTPPDSARERLLNLVRRTVDDACADEEHGHEEDPHDPASPSPQANQLDTDRSAP